MKRIPVIKLIREQAEAIIYYDDYWDDIERDYGPEESFPNLPNPLPEYTIEGDEGLVAEFEVFVYQNDRTISIREHFPMAWSKAGRLGYLFAQEKGIKQEYILPEEYKQLVNQPNIPGMRVY
ncbi:MAG: hypothetical protein LBI18_12815 [Planctomycetaceae bacterium]|jgi:hypothetical protein|nr:hypothetical protein [Planctomycetaceae bacterium]